MTDIPPLARAYVVAVMGLGGIALWSAMPAEFSNPELLLVLLFAAMTGSALKFRLPLSKGELTLSVSFVSIFMAVLLLDRGAALVVAALSAWTQCTFRPQQPVPTYRAVFSVAVMVLAAEAAGRVFGALGGPGAESMWTLVVAVPAAGAAFFIVNSALVSLAVSAASGMRFKAVWLDGLLWAAASYIVEAAAAAAMAALVINIGLLVAPLMVAPVWLNYRVFQARIAAMTALPAIGG